MVVSTRAVLVRHLDAKSISPGNLPERPQVPTLEIFHKWHRGESHDANAHGALLLQTARLVAKHDVGRMTANTELLSRVQANADGGPGASCKFTGGGSDRQPGLRGSHAPGDRLGRMVGNHVCLATGSRRFTNRRGGNKCFGRDN